MHGAEVTIASALAGLVPVGVVTAATSIDGRHLDDLLPAERKLVADAAAARRAQFATGRHLLRTVLAELAPSWREPLLVGTNRAPLLPPGIVGTLAHDSDIAVCVAARTSTIEAVGVDIEPLTTLTDDEAALIVADDEVPLDPLRAFVAKEAVYKAWSMRGGEFLDHHDLCVRIDQTSFIAEHRTTRSRYIGRVVEIGGRLLAVAWPDRS
jgi:4'-phosphopantetheinyl transferase EntD